MSQIACGDLHFNLLCVSGYEQAFRTGINQAVRDDRRIVENNFYQSQAQCWFSHCGCRLWTVVLRGGGAKQPGLLLKIRVYLGPSQPLGLLHFTPSCVTKTGGEATEVAFESRVHLCPNQPRLLYPFTPSPGKQLGMKQP